MLTIGQKVIAFGSLLGIVAISIFIGGIFAFLLVPTSIVMAIMLWKL